MLLQIILIIVAIIVVAGIIRIIIKAPSSIFEGIMDIFFLDCLFDVLGAILTAIFEGLGD